MFLYVYSMYHLFNVFKQVRNSGPFMSPEVNAFCIRDILLESIFNIAYVHRFSSSLVIVEELELLDVMSLFWFSAIQ